MRNPVGTGPLSLTVARDGQVETIQITPRRIHGRDRPAIGVGVRTLNLRTSGTENLHIGAPGISGPSAGLMFALAIYDGVEPVDLARGRVIAGTGTIDTAGRVGAVGGIAQKVQGAIEAGASVFLVPASQADRATDAANGRLEVIPVDSFAEARDRLLRG